MNVQLRYGAFTQAMSIHIDGQPLSHVSRLTKYQSRPFESWCEEICDAIAEEVNGRYNLSYMGRSCEARILGQFARNNPNCQSFSAEAPPISESAIVRLKRLSSLVQSGLSCQRFATEMLLYTDGDSDEISSIVAKGVPKLAFCKVRLQVLPLSEIANHPSCAPAYVLIVNDFALGERILSSMNTQKAVLVYADNQYMSLQMNNTHFVEHTSLQNCLTILEQYFELWTYADILMESLKRVSISENDPNYPQVAALDKQEPMTQVILPKSIEHGETASVKVRTIPSGVVTDKITYRISDPTVIQETPEGLKAVGVGEAVVEAYRAGYTVKLTSQKITCYRRNRIQTIKIRNTQIEMLVGDRYSMAYEYSPVDADDASKVKLTSSDGTIVAIDNGLMIRARAPGTCTVSVRSERASASSNIKVYPRVEAINVDVESINASIGDLVKLNINRQPADATYQKIEYSVSPPSLGRYDSSLKGFFAQSSGQGELVISTTDGSVKKRLPIKVKPAKAKAINLIKPISLIVVAIIILYFILKGA